MVWAASWLATLEMMMPVEMRFWNMALRKLLLLRSSNELASFLSSSVGGLGTPLEFLP